MIGHISIAGVLIHLTILLAASAGGLLFSTTVAMIIAAIIGIAELSFTGMIAVYGMTGFFAGALKRFGKLGIAVGGVVVSLFFFMYDLTLPIDSTHFYTIGIATMFFLLIPSKKTQPLEKNFSRKLSITRRKGRSGLSERLDEQLNDFQQFTEFMSSLVGERELGHGIPKNAAMKTPAVCNSCFRYSKCWESADDDMDSAD